MNKNKKLIIIEGFDGCGKTTLAENILKNIPGKYIKNGYEGSINANIARGLEILADAINSNIDLVIFDRFHGISDAVLDINREYTNAHNILCNTVAYMQGVFRDIHVIWLHAPKEVIITRLSQRDNIVPLERLLISNFDKCEDNAVNILTKYSLAGDITIHKIDTSIMTQEETAMHVLSNILGGSK